MGDLDGTVHAVNVRDGSRLWTLKTGGDVRSSPTIAGDLVLIGSYDMNLYALNFATGTPRWKLETDGPLHATPAVVAGVAYITGCDENFRAVRMSDGRELFRIPTGAYAGASPLLDGGRAYLGTFKAEVLAVDLRARQIVWRYRNPDRGFPFSALLRPRDGATERTQYTPTVVERSSPRSHAQRSLQIKTHGSLRPRRAVPRGRSHPEGHLGRQFQRSGFC